MGQAVVLLGKGGYGTTPQEELDRLVAAVRASGRYAPVEGAFIDQGAPTITAALQRCVDAGAERILVAPVFVPMDRSLHLWLPQILRRWLRRRPNRERQEVDVILADSLGDRPTLGQAALETVDAAAANGGRVDIQSDLGLEYANPGWSQIPAHSHHAFICTGPRCNTRGALDLYQHLRDRLAEHDLVSGRQRVSTVRSGCLYPCNLGPVMVVYPEGAWYCGLTPHAIDRIVEEHFANGRVVARYARKPGSGRYTRPEPADPDDIVEDDPPEIWRAARQARRNGVAKRTAVTPAAT
ncbi:MAG TPA: (2Fe-2S) ferredoxin domain-containing protein [Chloroflexota bacterium]|nr:(2Fe-2S) ferredoxin domain-containing protein [Chloroflexota bacterium]